MSDTPTPQPVDPTSEPEQIRPSATGLVVPADDSRDSGEGVRHPTGQRQAEENAENDPPA
jgi:hypothetical protein